MENPASDYSDISKSHKMIQQCGIPVSGNVQVTIRVWKNVLGSHSVSIISDNLYTGGINIIISIADKLFVYGLSSADTSCSEHIISYISWSYRLVD